MLDTVKRVEVPSGGWWEIETRPRWKHVRDFQNGTEWDTLKHILSNLTTAWSFRDAITPESISERSKDDLAAVLEFLDVEIAACLDDGDLNGTSEKLFSGMVTGQIPPEFAEIHIMAITGWSWQTLQETPADVVQKMMLYLSIDQARNTNGSLEFVNEQGEQHAKQ